MPYPESTRASVLLIEASEAQRAALTRGACPREWIVAEPRPGQTWLGQFAGEPCRILMLDETLLAGPGSGDLAELRQRPGWADVRVVLLLADGTAESRARAYALGADEVLAKPYDIDDVKATITAIDRFEVTFWGVRGTLPVVGPRALRHGGNTSCLGVDIGRDRHFVFDGGTGLRSYARYLMEQRNGRFDGRVFITHPHWDHLNCLPFFTPIYIPGNHISVMGPPQGQRSFRDLLEGQMDGTYFPITVEAFGADVTYGDLQEGSHCFDGISLRAFHLSHPGYCLGYRIDRHGRSLAYITDNELGNLPPGSDYHERLADFLSGVDMLIHDTAYFDHEYPTKINWGHSSIRQVVHLAAAARVGKLFLFHHDPEHGDRELDQKLETAISLAAALGGRFECLNACEGDVWDLSTVEKIRPRNYA